MSSAHSSTRDRILTAALSLVDRAKGPIAMAAIAKAAGVSRQALYLTFTDRADLFIALVRFVDEKRGLAQELAKIEAAPTGVEALLAVVDLQARLNPGLRPLFEALELLRRQDPAVERAWQDRLANRLKGCREIVRRMAEEKSLRSDLQQDQAADLVWTVTSLRMWDDLVGQRGWTSSQYYERITNLLCSSVIQS